MVNKPFLHINDSVLASYTFGCVKIYDFVLYERHLREVLIFFFIRRKLWLKRIESSMKFTEMLLKRKQTCRDWFRHFKDGDFNVVSHRVKEGQKPSNTVMLFIMSCWNCEKNVHNTSRGMKKWLYSLTTLGHTLPNLLKPSWKCSNGKSYPTRRIPQILHHPIITYSGRWHMVWLSSSFAHMKTSKNVLIRG